MAPFTTLELAYGRPVISFTGKASMSARSSTQGEFASWPDRVLERTPRTPRPPIFRSRFITQEPELLVNEFGGPRFRIGKVWILVKRTVRLFVWTEIRTKLLDHATDTTLFLELLTVLDSVVCVSRRVSHRTAVLRV